MTDSVKQQKQNDVVSSKLHDSSSIISSFEQLCAFLREDLRFAEYQVDLPADHVLSLSNDQFVIVIIDNALWLDQQKLKSFVEGATAGKICLVCAGSEEAFAKHSHELDHTFIHQVVFPTSLRTLDFQLRGLLRSRQFHDQAHQSKQQADETSKNILHVLSISRELNGVRDVNRLLSLILEKARAVTHADAGSVFVVEPATGNQEAAIVFKVTQNASVPVNMSEFRMPISDRSIVGNSVLLAQTINIADLYALDSDPSKNPFNATHDASWDLRNGYECHSMVSIPIFDISHQVIGVIQLINAKIGDRALHTEEDFKTRVIPFNSTAVEYGEIVAHQAGIALENALLTEEKEALFEGFVNASVKAIEQRDPTTSGHSHRVARLTLDLAMLVDRVDVGLYRGVKFTEDQMKEIEFASLLHDFGKLGVREQVLLKAKKLYPWEMETLLERFELIKARFEIDYLNELISFMHSPQMFPPGVGIDQFTTKRNVKLRELTSVLEFVLKANEPTVLEQGGFERLKDIANYKFVDSNKNPRTFLKPNELKALSVSRGSLTSEEFSEIQSHVVHTFEFLRTIPWGRNLANVPHIAAKHHEKLDGSGYPTSAYGDDIPIQSRMMAIADIFDALTAADRPYKKAVPVPKALEIIEMDVKSGKCDPELFKIFVESKSYQAVIESHSLG